MRKKIIAFILTAALLVICCSCSMSNSNYVDGEYHVEFSDFDASGYKEFIDVVVKDGSIVSFSADAVDREGNLKSESEDYGTRMKSVTGNYPEKFYRDFANQYLERGSSADIDIVAGATISTNNLVKLVMAMEAAARTGLETEIIVDSSEPNS